MEGNDYPIDEGAGNFNDTPIQYGKISLICFENVINASFSSLATNLQTISLDKKKIIKI